MKKEVMQKILVIIEVLIIWELGSMAIQKECLPSPFVVITTVGNLVVQGTIFWHVLDSAKRIVLGILFGILFSIPVGLVLGYFPRVNQLLGGLFDFLYTIPKVVFLPLIIVLLGIGDLPKVFLIAMVLFFQQTVVIRDAAKKISPELTKAILVWGANNWQILWYLVIPSCLPDLMTSPRMSLGTAIALLFITENFASVTGLGYYITTCMDRRDYNEMFAAIIVLALIGLILYAGIDVIEKRICYWKYLEQQNSVSKE